MPGGDGSPGGGIRDAAWRLPLWGAAERIRADVGIPLPTGDASRYEQRVAAARAELGDDASFDAAWAEGCAMTLEQTFELALDDVAIETVVIDQTARGEPRRRRKSVAGG